MTTTILDYPLIEAQWLIAYKVQHTKSSVALKLSASIRKKLRLQVGLTPGYRLHQLPVSLLRASFSLRSQGKPSLPDRLGITRLVLNWIYGLSLHRRITYIELQDAMVAICIGAILEGAGEKKVS